MNLRPSYAVILVVGSLLSALVEGSVNNLPCNARPLDLHDQAVYVLGDMSTGTRYTTPLDGCSLPENSLWYTLQPPKNGTLYATTCSQDTTFDSQLTLLTSSADNCNAITTCLSSANQTRGQCKGKALTYSVVERETYYLAVSGATSGSFELALKIDYTNRCDSAEVLPVPSYGLSWVSGSLRNAVPWMDQCHNYTSQLTHWYKVTLESNKFPFFVLSTCHTRNGSVTQGKAEIALTNGCFGSYLSFCGNQLPCPDGGGGMQQILEVVHLWGNHFYIGIRGDDHDQTFDLHYGYGFVSPGCEDAEGHMPLTALNQTIATTLTTDYPWYRSIARSPWFTLKSTFTGVAAFSASYATYQGDATALGILATPNPCDNLLASPRGDGLYNQTVTLPVRPGDLIHVVAAISQFRDIPENDINIFFGASTVLVPE